MVSIMVYMVMMMMMLMKGVGCVNIKYRYSSFYLDIYIVVGSVKICRFGGIGLV